MAAERLVVVPIEDLIVQTDLRAEGVLPVHGGEDLSVGQYLECPKGLPKHRTVPAAGAPPVAG